MALVTSSTAKGEPMRHQSDTEDYAPRRGGPTPADSSVMRHPQTIANVEPPPSNPTLHVTPSTPQRRPKRPGK